MSEGVFDITTGKPVDDEPMTDEERDSLLERMDAIHAELQDHADDLRNS